MSLGWGFLPLDAMRGLLYHTAGEGLPEERVAPSMTL